MSWETFRFVAVTVLIAISVAIVLYLLVRRLRRRPPTGPARQMSLGIRRLHADVAELRQRLDEMRAELAEKLPERMDALNNVCRDADERIAELRRLTDSGEQDAQDAGCGENESPEILRLSRQGLDPVEIARRMKMPVGEVELVLRLHESVEQR